MDAALLAALAGVIGIVLGRLWDSRSEAARWRRDQETVSYQRLAEAFIVLYEEIRSVALTERDTDALTEAIERARRDKTWDNALVAVWLYGSTSVVTAASLMDRTVTKLFYDAQARQHSAEDWNRARIRSTNAFEAFLAAIRKDISLPPISARVFPYAPD